MLFVVCSLISGIMEMEYLSGSSDQESVFERLLSPPVITGSNVIGVMWSGLTTTWDYLTAFFAVLTFDYAFFSGAYQIIRWIIFLPIGIAMILTLALAVIRGVGSE